MGLSGAWRGPRTTQGSVQSVVLATGSRGEIARSCGLKQLLTSQSMNEFVQRMSGNGGSCMSGEHPSNQSKMSAGLTEHSLPLNERGRVAKEVFMILISSNSLLANCWSGCACCANPSAKLSKYSSFARARLYLVVEQHKSMQRHDKGKWI